MREHLLSPQQRMNLLMSKQIAQRHGATTPGSIVCISLDRNPRREFGKWMRFDNLVCTLRTGNDLLWILMYNELGDLVLSRGLHPYERFALQGFPPIIGESLSKQEILIATGNAMSVPVIGAVMNEVIKLLVTSGVSPIANPPRCLETDAAIKQLRKRKLADEIASLDGESLRYEAMKSACLQAICFHTFT
jgi:hypothetical protein